MIRSLGMICAFMLCCHSAIPLTGADVSGWKAGTAKAVITPEKPIWMAGYGGRTEPATGKEHDLFIRVLALEDAGGHRGIILSSDTLGMSKTIYDRVSEQLQSQFGLDRSQFMLHASHTHCGPVLQQALPDIYPLNEQQREDVREYTESLTAKIVTTIGQALGQLEPATLYEATGFCDFAVNRRTNREPDVPTLRAENQLMGPVDHSVPVLVVKNAASQVKALFFIYACHNTTLSYQKWCGDYAGFAQFALEEKYPTAIAMFGMGCGADQNPLPRRTVELCQEYGGRLANSVDSAVKTSLTPIPAKLETKHRLVSLKMGPLPPESQLKRMAEEPVSYSQRWASRMLQGQKRLWITLGGEVVVDYALRLKAELGESVWVSAYTNDVMAYIPSKRVLMEGGYEGQSSMMVYGMPTERWAPDVEERLMEGVSKTIQSLTP